MKEANDKSKEHTDKIWDVVVIGGGPAGMIAAGRAGELGADVLLLEKNKTLGKKLLITGGGRCNVMNAEMDTRKLLEKFGDDGKFLFSTFSQFGASETLHFFNSHGLQTKVEPGLRVFPVSDSSQSVHDILTEYMQARNVTVLPDSPFKGFKKEGNKIVSVILQDGREIHAKTFILATGGKSRPETGSTGDGFRSLQELGHTIIEPSVSLVPIAIRDTWVKRLQGITLPEVKITLLLDNKKQETKKGRLLFTHFGVSGPTILNLSRSVGELLKYGEVTISLDLFPTLGNDGLNSKLQELWKEQNRKLLKNSLTEIIPTALVPAVLELAHIAPETSASSVTREERLRLVAGLKAMRMQVSGLLGTDKAIVSSGGVVLTEVDFKTMSSKIFPNLFLIGDILNIDRPSGGYSLQLCWTTGFVAGTHASKRKLTL